MKLDRVRLLRFGALGAVIGASACNGKLAVLSEPVDGAGNAIVMPDSAQVQAELAKCPELVVDPSDTDPPPPPVQCGVCSCGEGQQLACDQAECMPPFVLPHCKDGSDPAPDAEIVRSSLEGELLHIDVKGYGGCGADDFELCYLEPGESTYASQRLFPKFATVRVSNPTRTACRRWRGRPRPACACNRGRRSLRQSNTCKQTIPYRLRRRPWNLGRRSS